jgi:mRNA-degrading endonuclease RelE of RelBE toxin-antitoxin system
MFKIRLTPEAEQDLRWFRKHERNEILDAIEAQLGYEPAVKTRARKQLRPNQTTEWELRVDKFRVFYDVNEQEQVVLVEAVGLKIGNRLFFRGEEREL